MSDGHLERLLAELGERAKSEIAQATAAGQVEAERLRAAAQSRAGESMTIALARCEVEQARIGATAIAAARRRARTALLEAQHAFVDRAMTRAAALIGDRLRSAGPAATQHRVDLLVSYAPEGDAQVQQDAEGIRVTSNGGLLRIDDTVGAWLAQSRAELAILICRAAEAAPVAGADA